MWEICSADQLRGFLLATVTGFLLCMGYDLVRGLRCFGHSARSIISVQDALYGTFGGIVTFCLMLICTNGEPRAYIFFGEIIGFVLCRLTLSKILFSIFRKFAMKLSRIFCSIRKKYSAFLGAFCHVTALLIHGFDQNLKKFNIFLKKLLKNSGNVLYTMINSIFQRKGGSKVEEITQSE